MFIPILPSKWTSSNETLPHPSFQNNKNLHSLLKSLDYTTSVMHSIFEMAVWKNPRKLRLISAASWQNQQSDCAPSEDSDQPGHLPSLIRVFAVCMKKAWVLSYSLSAQRRLWTDWADAQADLSLRWAHNHIVGFVMRRLIRSLCTCIRDTASHATVKSPRIIR